MRILYVTGLFAGLADILHQGGEPKGMPAFVRPLIRLHELGHEIDLIVATPEQQPIHSGVPWLTESNVEFVIWRFSNTRNRILSFLSLYRAVRRRLHRANYDFIYGHGSEGAIGNLVAIQTQIPCGMRLYGTPITDKALAARGNLFRRLRLAMSHPLEFLAFTLPKEFLIVTNDGSQADLVHDAIGRPVFRLEHWLNGVDESGYSVSSSRSTAGGASEPFLLYPARIAEWKRQERALELLKLLRHRHDVIVRLKIVGHVSEPTYLKELQYLAKQWSLCDQVEFLGPLSMQQLGDLYQRCLAVLSFYDMKNLGNVVIEALYNGCVVISLDDGSLDEIIDHSKNGYKVSDMDEAAAIIANGMNDPESFEQIGHAAALQARQKFSGWDMRVKKEIELIKSAVGQS